jgi:hypothetical protein
MKRKIGETGSFHRKSIAHPMTAGGKVQKFKLREEAKVKLITNCE